MKSYSGQIEKISVSDGSWPNSPWECIVCRYFGDDGELEQGFPSVFAFYIYMYYLILGAL